ncbi:hypothetical protein Pint_24652 [Pistacia integerrima]|uniref:Uncharacterized protein n=1 Tax=Pistacia integerrima TaxID=434235 RepID=A0ACC0YFY2_9ROSI|nr:hypothetical protein Pint_24652 [Pistacia integerrima]
MRPLNEKPLLNKYFPGLALTQSLQAALVPPIAGSPCTNIPRNNGGSCPSSTVTGSMNIAGGVIRAPPAIARNVNDMAVAS